ncbi:hypothetical protein [Streptomyces sp. NPDC001068]|uniref:hypothetical protein n=1 Tax=Streptomyces sp. NPDC001068 TaxID=3364544 RepID=UPI0036809449
MSANRPIPAVTVVSAGEDDAIASSLRTFLLAAGLPLRDDSAADVVVILISQSAVDDQGWRERVDAHRGVRLVPMRIDAVRSSRAPEHLRPVNWVTLDPESPVTAFGTVLAAVLSDPEHIHALRNLRAEAEAWVRGGRQTDRLVDDHRRALEAHDLLTLLRQDDYIDTGGPVGEFVEASYRHTRRSRNRRRRRRVAGTVLAAVMALIAAVTVPRILQAKGTDFNSLVTFGDPGSAREMPEWSSLQSARLLLYGNARQKAQARQTLAALLAVPWSLGGPAAGLDEDDHTVVDGMAVLPGSRRVALLVRDGTTGANSLGLYDIRAGTVLWRIPLGAGYADIAAAADGRRVAAVGKRGTAVVDLRSRKIRTFRHVESGYASLHVTLDDHLVVGRQHRLVVGSLDGSGFRTVGARYDSLLSLEATSDGGARALVTAGPGRYRLLDAITGKVLAVTDTAEPLIAAGAVGPDQVYAVFAGADRQLWELRPGRPPARTGIAVAERTTTIGLLSRNRVVVGGQDQRAHVFRLDDGGDLGVVCRDVPRLTGLVFSPYTDVLGCFGPYNSALWRAPAGPRAPGAAGAPRLGTRIGDARAGVRADGGRIVVEPSGRKPFTIGLFTSDVVATAVSGDGAQVLAAARSGEVAVVSLRMSDGLPRVVARWRIPGGRAATAVGWSGEEPLVRAADGAVWQAPGCPGCTTDDGLVARLRERLSGCWTDRQLTQVDGDTRHVLGVDRCRPMPDPEKG